MFKLRWGPSAFVVSLLALVLSLGGTSFAVTAASQAGDATSTRPPAAPPAWHNLTLLNGWKRFPGTVFYVPSYLVDSGHFVHLRGVVLGGTLGQPAFQLPRGARPAHRVEEPVSLGNGGAGLLVIVPTGSAFLTDSGGGSQAQAQTSLDGVTFGAP